MPESPAPDPPDTATEARIARSAIVSRASSVPGAMRSTALASFTSIEDGWRTGAAGGSATTSTELGFVVVVAAHQRPARLPARFEDLLQAHLRAAGSLGHLRVGLRCLGDNRRFLVVRPTPPPRSLA